MATAPRQTEANEPQRAGVIFAGNVEVDLEGYRAMVGGKQAMLTYQEFELLTLLVRQAGKVVPYEELTRACWSGSGQRELRRLGVLVCRLRAKLAEASPYRIKTVRRRGYGLVSMAG